MVSGREVDEEEDIVIYIKGRLKCSTSSRQTPNSKRNYFKDSE